MKSIFQKKKKTKKPHRFQIVDEMDGIGRSHVDQRAINQAMYSQNQAHEKKKGFTKNNAGQGSFISHDLFNTVFAKHQQNVLWEKKWHSHGFHEEVIMIGPAK